MLSLRRQLETLRRQILSLSLPLKGGERQETNLHLSHCPRQVGRKYLLTRIPRVGCMCGWSHETPGHAGPSPPVGVGTVCGKRDSFEVSIGSSKVLGDGAASGDGASSSSPVSAAAPLAASRRSRYSFFHSSSSRHDRTIDPREFARRERRSLLLQAFMSSAIKSEALTRWACIRLASTIDRTFLGYFLRGGRLAM